MGIGCNVSHVDMCCTIGPQKNDPLEEHILLLPECKFAKLQKNSPELTEELWDNDCLQSVFDLGYSTVMVERAYFKVLHRIKEKEKINSAMLIDELICEECDTDADIMENCYRSDKQVTPTIPIFAELAERKCVDIQHAHNILEKIEELKKENEKLRESYKCHLCQEKANAVFLPCGHLAVCLGCTKKRKDCARCGTLIRGIVRVYTV